jgi:hypothetical protein
VSPSAPVPEFDDHGVTPEVGDEGGSEGTVEIAIDSDPGTGSEATETWQPSRLERREIRRDETDTE